MKRRHWHIVRSISSSPLEIYNVSEFDMFWQYSLLEHTIQIELGVFKSILINFNRILLFIYSHKILQDTATHGPKSNNTKNLYLVQAIIVRRSLLFASYSPGEWKITPYVFYFLWNITPYVIAITWVTRNELSITEYKIAFELSVGQSRGLPV